MLVFYGLNIASVKLVGFRASNPKAVLLAHEGLCKCLRVMLATFFNLIIVHIILHGVNRHLIIIPWLTCAARDTVIVQSVC